MSISNNYLDILTSTIENVTLRSIDAIRHDAQRVHRIYVSSDKITVKEATYTGMENSCPVFWYQDDIIRNFDLFSSSTRGSNSPLAAPFFAMGIQGGTSFINFQEKLFKGDLIDLVQVGRLEQADEKTKPSFLIKLMNCRIVYARNILVNEHWIGCLIMQVTTIQTEYAPNDIKGKASGKVVSSNNFLTGAAG